MKGNHRKFSLLEITVLYTYICIHTCNCLWCEAGTYLTSNEPYRLTNSRLRLATDGELNLFIGNETQVNKLIGTQQTILTFMEYFLTIPNDQYLYIAASVEPTGSLLAEFINMDRGN